MLGALAQAEGLGVQGVGIAEPVAAPARAMATNSWLKCGMQARALAPTSSATTGTSRQPRTRQAFAVGQGFHPAFAAAGFLRLGGQECGADGVGALGGQLEARHRAEEFVGDLGQDAGAVARALIGAHGAAVFQVAQGNEGLLRQCRGRGCRGGWPQWPGRRRPFRLRAVQPRLLGHGGKAREG